MVLGIGSVWNSLIWSQYFPVSLQEATSKVGRHKAFAYAQNWNKPAVLDVPLIHVFVHILAHVTLHNLFRG